jgi:tetratricopeptide (TPR) repeat protein
MAVDFSDRAEFSKFLRGELPSGKNREVVRQMLAASRSALAPSSENPADERAMPPMPSMPSLSPTWRSAAWWPAQPSSPTRPAALPRERAAIPSGYSRAFHNTSHQLTASLEELAGEREQLPALIARLLALPYREQRLLVRADRGLQSWALCEWLVEESHRLTYADLVKAEETADLAVTLADSLDPRHYGQELVNDIKARAWCCVGEVLRTLSDLRSAEEAFTLAEKLVAHGTGDALEEANLLERKAALCRDQHKLADAHSLLDDAIAVYRKYRDFHLVGRAFVQKGRVYGSSNEAEAAIRWLRKGLGLIDPTRERRLELAARHSLMLYLHQSGKHQEAWFLLKASRPEFVEYGGELLKLRLRWLEGKIQLALGLLQDAEGALLEARQGFLQQGVGFSAASVSLDLASLYAGQGRAAEMRQLAEEMLPIFRSQDVHREAIAALLVFQQAVRMERVSADLLGEIQSYLRRARKDHKLRFEYPA